MAIKENAVVLNFKLKGQIEYAKTIKDINTVMNAAAKEYRANIRAMGDEATATDKLTAEKKKLEVQLRGAQERTEKLRNEFELMQGNTKATTSQLNYLYGKLKDSESAEITLERAMKRVNDGLSDQAEESRKNQKALDGLQTESRELELQSEKLNSEFKLQQSELGKNATEADKAALAQEHLGKKSELVEKQISNLESQLKLVKGEFGENSEEANKMEIELNEAKTAFNNLGREMEDMHGQSGQATDGMGKLTDILSSQVYMEVADRLSAISDKLYDIGQYSIEAAATFRASEAQFEQVFGDMEGQAQQTVEDLGAQFGILPNRLKPAYAAITSQFMSLGIGQKEAMEMSADATTKAADAAAFYDLSLDDAQGRVQSFLKGNLSAAESIGIFASVASLNAYTVENLGEKYSDMSEQQKQAVRLEYIDHLYDQAQVTGQAAREMDQYENVMGNAKSVQDEFNAALGDAALEMLVDTMGQLIPIIVDFTSWFKELNPAIKDGIVIVGGILIVIGKLLPLLATLGAAAAVAGTTIGALVTGVILPAIGIIAGVVAAITAVILIIKNWGAISDWIKEKWSQAVDFISKKIGDLGEWFDETISGIAEYWSNLFNDLAESVSKGISAINEKWQGLKDGAVAIWTYVIEAVVEKVLELKQSVEERVTLIGDFFIGVWESLVERVTPVLQFLVDAIMVPISFIQTMLAAFWLLIQAGFGIAWEFIKQTTAEAWSLIKDYIITPITEAYDFVVQKFVELGEWLNQKWIEFSNFALEIWSMVKENIISPIVDAYHSVVQWLSDMLTAIVAKFTEIAKSVSDKWSEIKSSIIENLMLAKESVTKLADDIWTSVTDKFESLWKSTKTVFKKIGDAIVAPIIWAKDKIAEAIENIKEFFASIKFPKFSLKTSTKTVMGKDFEIPSGIDVKWNAKGGIFTQPTIFGASGGQLQGAGEAGPEAVLPLNEETLGVLGKSIAANMPGGIEQHVHIGRVDTNNMSDLNKMNQGIQKSAEYSNFALGGD